MAIDVNSKEFKDALKTVLIGLGYDAGDDVSLRKYKGIENPTDDQVAMWQAYGLFNALQDISQDIDMADSFVIAINDYINENGGWDYIPNDD